MFISIGNFSSNIVTCIDDKLSAKFNDSYFKNLKLSSVKDYEDSFDVNNAWPFSQPKDDKIYIVLDGEDPISGISLKVIEYLKSFNNEIYVFLIIKDEKSLTKLKRQNQNFNYTIYQEIARSGEISRLFLIDLSLVITKFKISLKNFENTISDSVSKIIKNCVFVLNNTPIYGTKFTTNEIKRISTFGVILGQNISQIKSEEFYFHQFKMNELCQRHYIFHLNEEELSDGDNSLSQINSLLENRESDDSYSIFESGSSNSVYYIIKSTNYVDLVI